MVASGLVVDLLICKIDQYVGTVVCMYYVPSEYPCRDKNDREPTTNMCTLTCQTCSIVNLTRQPFLAFPMRRLFKEGVYQSKSHFLNLLNL